LRKVVRTFGKLIAAIIVPKRSDKARTVVNIHGDTQGLGRRLEEALGG
jgi:hypothetical protein